jgi:hypothetical protein
VGALAFPCGGRQSSTAVTAAVRGPMVACMADPCGSVANKLASIPSAFDMVNSALNEVGTALV